LEHKISKERVAQERSFISQFRVFAIATNFHSNLLFGGSQVLERSLMW
jgi:hypothetical protein